MRKRIDVRARRRNTSRDLWHAVFELRTLVYPCECRPVWIWVYFCLDTRKRSRLRCEWCRPGSRVLQKNIWEKDQQWARRKIIVLSRICSLELGFWSELHNSTPTWILVNILLRRRLEPIGYRNMEWSFIVLGWRILIRTTPLPWKSI